MVAHYETILLDLDGTLVDSAPGITQSIAYTLREMGLAVPPMSELLHWVGPPLPRSFQERAGLDEAGAMEAISIYRERYLEIGAYDSKLFDGTGALLRDLKKQGRHLALATSKPHTPAILMMEHFTLVPFFDVIATARDDETRGAKHEVIEDALAGLREKGLPTESMVMVGDRVHDVDGGKAHGMDTVIVQWGYGTPDEWEQAHHQIATPRQLRRLLGLPTSRTNGTH